MQSSKVEITRNVKRGFEKIKELAEADDYFACALGSDYKYAEAALKWMEEVLKRKR